MDRWSLLRSVWIAPLLAALLASGLCWTTRPGTPRISLEGPPSGSAVTAWPAAPPETSEAAVPWLPPLAEPSRTLLTAYTLVRPASATEAAVDGPSLTPWRTWPSESPQPRATVGPPLTGQRQKWVVPEPELLPDGTTGGGEPIPPRLPQPSSSPGPAPDLAGAPALAAPSVARQPAPVEPPPAPPAVSETSPAGQQPGMLLAPALDASHRSQNLELIANEADGHSRHGFDLAGRGACFSARSEFISALRMLAQALDTEAQTRLHSQALATGLAAMREADDFLPSGAKLEADLDLRGIVGRHRTPVLKGTDPAGLTPMVALQRYLTFAQEQLAAAVGGEVAGSMALRGLGKVHEAMAERRLQSVQIARPKAMAFYQAALLACPQNYLASNDLGVLLARSGRPEDARLALEHSLSIQQQPTSWHNLAMVYQQLGRADWAQLAQHRSASLQPPDKTKPSGHSGAAGSVQWFDPQTFAQTSPEQPNAPASNLPTRPPAGLNAAAADPQDAHVAQSPSRTSPDKRK